MRPQHTERREAAVIQRLVLKERDIELVRNKRVRNVLGKRRMTLYRRQSSRPASFVGRRVGFPDSQSKRRVVIEEKRCHVIVENKEKVVRLLLREPVANGLIALE